MKVKNLMKTDVGCCSSENNLKKAIEVMRLRDCGAVPIVDDKNKLIGIITDRDVCLAIAEADEKPSEIKISGMMKSRIISCAADDNIEEALKKMKRVKVKRLPVVDKNKEVIGILSITDFLNSSEKDKSLKKKIYSTLEAIGKPHPIVLREISESEL